MNPCPAKYTDAKGEVQTSISNDGETLRINIRGVEFTGTDFDSLQPADDATPDQLGLVSLNVGRLCSCQIECELPIPVYGNGQELTGKLTIVLQLGDPAPNGGRDRQELLLCLEVNEQSFAGSGISGWFEDELIEIQDQLPGDTYIRACINCLYSDYSPYGHGLFGCMMCFRNLKQEYLKIQSKDEFWSVHDRFDRMVQETYLCPEFKRRILGTGYRG